MKQWQVSVFLMSILWGCRSDISSPTVFENIVGIYSKVADQPTFVIRQLFPTHQNFRYTTTASITQTGGNTYRIHLKMSGVAQKGNATDAYEFVASYDFELFNQASTQWVRGDFTSILPSSAIISTKSSEMSLRFYGKNLEIKALVNINLNRNTDAAPVVEGILTR